MLPISAKGIRGREAPLRPASPVCEVAYCARSIVGKSLDGLDALADTGFAARGAISNGDKGKVKGSVLYRVRGQTRKIYLCSAYRVFAA